jgi:hypothetical protein
MFSYEPWHVLCNDIACTNKGYGSKGEILFGITIANPLEVGSACHFKITETDTMNAVLEGLGHSAACKVEEGFTAILKERRSHYKKA